MMLRMALPMMFTGPAAPSTPKPAAICTTMAPVQTARTCRSVRADQRRSAQAASATSAAATVTGTGNGSQCRELPEADSSSSPNHAVAPSAAAAASQPAAGGGGPPVVEARVRAASLAAAISAMTRAMAAPC